VNTAVKSAAAPVQAWWRSLAERERRLVVVASAVLVVGVVWALLVQPAWRTLSRAPAELDRLETQLQTMQQLAAETQQLRAAPPITPDEASAALNAATARLGDKGKLLIQGNRATLTLTGVGSGALRDWLTEARAGARAKPIEANLTRATQGYSGSLVLTVGGAAP
jgi:general secretion pathway protein M